MLYVILPRTRMRLALAAAMIPATSASPALAQYTSGVSGSVEIASDERRRGLSWSEGDPVLRGTISAPVAEGLSLDASAVSLWGSDRHGNADTVIDVGPTFVQQVGGWRLSGEARYHLFPGASDQGYGELGAGAGFLIGPASIDLFASYAPSQSTIGGDNLYLSASATAGVPGTPFTLSARIGRSSGDVHDPLQAARLRPDGSYWDYGFGIDYLKERWTAGVRYADSSIAGTGSRHAGPSLIGRLALGF